MTEYIHDGITIALVNEDDEPEDNFTGKYKGYEITVTLDRITSRWYNERNFEVWLYDPDGKAIISGQHADTIEQGVFMCVKEVG